MAFIFNMASDGWVHPATHVRSPNTDTRPEGSLVELLVVHNISLPPNQFGGPGVVQLFTNTLPPDEHPFYAQVHQLRVSAHFFIRRDGELVQFVSCLDRAWHAGVSSWRGRARCNDFSIGVELEGSDFVPFTDLQYDCLTQLGRLLRRHFPIVDVQGHSDIAPGRKTDPGPYFDWQRILDMGVPHVA
ncbi:AmpD protein [Chitinivorax tropicus]|uniref:1,6-anhydro-N-acetylmuramyl-L-alanine amidase AmpD n=1 Tax=Chitinivorax tropicus TaxID=714531 RepID=A0A840MS82_9PROT|nr:1,6-anhydro-N-acetylmuramyl-L-alanine amidase AmpD [Chitinivorax tropicus]MBB5020275.1 AmpD protein [Chitinivorax tropicus]